jgi:hypothetical protein
MPRKRQNLYLHFLDRKLRQSIGYELPETDVLRGVLAAVCLTPGRLFCSYSHLWESNVVFGDSFRLIEELMQAGELVPRANTRRPTNFWRLAKLSINTTLNAIPSTSTLI